MGSRRVSILWCILIAAIGVDFALTYFGITTGKAQEINPFTKQLWAERQYMPLFLYTFISTPFMIYGLYKFFDEKKGLLYMQIIYYCIIIANNILVTLVI